MSRNVLPAERNQAREDLDTLTLIADPGRRGDRAISLRVGIVLYPDAEELDWVGPYEAFTMAAVG